MRPHEAIARLFAIVLVTMCCGTGLACGPLLAMPQEAAFLRPGDHELSIEHDGRARSYLVHMPRAAGSGDPLPVVVNFHGGGGNAPGHKENSRMDAAADRDGYIAGYPNGTGRLRNRLLTWNAGGCCGYSMNQDIDDVGFTLAMLDDLGSRTPLDRRP